MKKQRLEPLSVNELFIALKMRNETSCTIQAMKNNIIGWRYFVELLHLDTSSVVFKMSFGSSFLLADMSR